MAGTTRLELATSAVTGQRSNQLNYVPTRQIYELCNHQGFSYRLVVPLPKTLIRLYDLQHKYPNSFQEEWESLALK